MTIEWIARHPDTPKLNSEDFRHRGFWFDSISPKLVGKRQWQIDVKSSTFTFPDLPDSPTARAAKISIDSELVEQPTLFDSKGKPIMTRAGEWISGVTVERPLLTYNIVKNLPADPGWLESHLGAVNSDAVKLRGRVCAQNTLMLRRCSFSEYTTENRVWYTTCSISLHYDPLTWIRKIWNRGVIQLVQVPRVVKGTSKLVWVQSRIKSGTPPQYIDDPVPLDAKGQVIDGVLTPDQSTPVDVSKMVILNFNVQPIQQFGGVLPLT